MKKKNPLSKANLRKGLIGNLKKTKFEIYRPGKPLLKNPLNKLVEEQAKKESFKIDSKNIKELKKLKLDKRFKIRKYYRVSPSGKLQFSDKHNKQLGFIGKTAFLQILVGDLRLL